MNDKLTPELHRVLLKRIASAVYKAKYYPANVDEHAVAEEVLRPYKTPEAAPKEQEPTVPWVDEGTPMWVKQKYGETKADIVKAVAKELGVRVVDKGEEQSWLS